MADKQEIVLKPFKTWLFTVLFLLCACPSFSADQTIASVADLALTDKGRNKELHLRITYPLQEGKYPIVIFSHGAGGSKDSYPYLIQYWASHDYICIQPTHADTVGKVADKAIAFKKLTQILRALPTDYQGWANRVADIKLILNSLPEIQRSLPQSVTMNAEQIGLAGHSYGAFTTVLVGGGTVPKVASSIVKDYHDKRVTAILVISPQGINRKARDFGFDSSASFSGITEPAMFMTGSLDQTGYTKARDRRAAFVDSPPPNKYFVQIKGANHMTFAGIPQTLATKTDKDRQAVAGFRQKRKQQTTLTGRLAKFFGPLEQGSHEQMLNAVEVASTVFWNGYLKDNDRDKQRLMSGSISTDNPLIDIESK